MARFILDVANADSKKIEKIMYDLFENTFLASEVASITCIDETNSNQFYDSPENNIISEEQITNYNKELKIKG